MTITHKFLIVTFTVFLLSTQCFAQETFEKPQARLVDEFGNEYPTRTAARLDNFVAELQNEPSAKGFIISYHSQTELAGKSVRTLKGCENYFTYHRKLGLEQFVFIEGGEAQNTVTELWIVPLGTTPKIRNDAYKKVFDDESAKKYDNYFFSFVKGVYVPDEEYDGCYGFCANSSLGAFAKLIKGQDDLTAYIIVYPELKDGKKIVVAMARKVSVELTKEHKLALSKFRIINGGFRRQRSVELWILPKGEHAPVATPNAFPKVRKKRK